MKLPLQVIAEYGCPTHSYVAALQHLSSNHDLTFVEYREGIQKIINLPEPPDCESWFYAKTLFLYCIQETIRDYQAGIIPDMDDIYALSKERTYYYIDNNPWATTRFNISHGLQSDEDLLEEALKTGKIIFNKGGKKELTEKLFKEIKAAGGGRHEIIQAFVDKVGMSKAGATTYFHGLKKEFGFSERTNPNKEIPKTENKQAIAERLYVESTDKSKATMIALFTEKLDTSKLGAQTYFYSCKKKYEKILHS
jgi:hypothetical protein